MRDIYALSGEDANENSQGKITMQANRRAFIIIALLLVLIGAGILVAATHVKTNADALWQIVSEKCLPDQLTHGQPAPCQHVDLQHRYALLKDRNGPLQYLLIPIDKITGIESPQLLRSDTPNYFDLSWQDRGVVAQKYGKPINDSVLSLAINSQYGRTQNQLHIHLSCLRPDVRKQLDALTPTFTPKWKAVTFLSHPYHVRTLSEAELAEQSVFIRLAAEIPHARDQMGRYGLALARLSDGRLILMAVERNWLLLNKGSAEEVQDHDCALLQPIKKAA